MVIVTPPYTWAIPMLTGWDLATPGARLNLLYPPGKEPGTSPGPVGPIGPGPGVAR